MSKKDQFDKNIKLQHKLGDYIAKNPVLLKKYGESSYVMFVEGDKKLNKINLELVESLKNRDKNKSVIMATLTKNKTNPWKFQFAS
ncbi:hypothetical protein ISR94_01715 [Candidatus Microgenomates bacterium]|nr:hypothetical protein [Candidatus Microgenomates bacterium]